MANVRQRARVELRALYKRVDADLAGRPGLFCRRSGRCCRFEEAGHELYLSRLEYEEMLAEGGPRAGSGGAVCPWLEEGLCANREGRALACRTYHCSEAARATELTERWHREVRRIHERWGLAYEYRCLRAHR